MHIAALDTRCEKRKRTFNEFLQCSSCVSRECTWVLANPWHDENSANHQPFRFRRLRVAVSSGWPTSTANMRRMHCPCWNFCGLEEAFEFSDIFGLVAPRRLLLENGLKEPVEQPGGFPTPIARACFAETQSIYTALGQGGEVTLEVHPGGHEWSGIEALPALEQELG
jgi:hypothetical protein